MQSNKIGSALIAFALSATSFSSTASVVISGTRVIYTLAEKEQTVRLSNDGKQSALVQIWLDDGDIKADPNTAKAPFLVSPPISRIDPGKGQSIRLIHTGEPVPQDVESIYYFNLLEVPPKPNAEQEAGQLLQFAFRTRIKLFLRPPGLEGEADEAAAKVTWKVERHDDTWEVIASNPTPYHVTFLNVDLKSAGAIATDAAGGMINPRGMTTFKPKGANSPASWTTLEYRFVNDHGGVTTGQVTLQK
ncbi:fimbria/pilus periplasmic chaperone [Pararobbsia alpina]|uniref:Putative fimbrial chaperone YadV n=1 Tax=Pararobbsia alpina TaxID=621374 RepID=A0A6S7CAK5_9BURK|nr:fimbria/pilus periplasmic chaperone [Pararobbsia alpina]CAB3785060.1 putative fimbrial chaperone YadV [Pararobbsia alpina]